MFEKQVTLTKEAGVWNAKFRVSQGQDPVTPAELQQLIRTLTVAHRDYLIEFRRGILEKAVVSTSKQKEKSDSKTQE